MIKNFLRNWSPWRLRRDRDYYIQKFMQLRTENDRLKEANAKAVELLKKI